MPDLFLHNTLSGAKEQFIPRNPDRVTMYVCGPTVYNLAHIGNARPVVVFDTLYRVLSSLFPSVVYARNITDIDDKIIDAARDRGASISAISEEFTRKFHEDMAQLHTLSPTIEPMATEHIDEMLSLTESLVVSGHAYAAEGHVLFSVESMADYGALSKRRLDDMLAGARVEVASYKRHPGDFVLWKPSSDVEPGWDSPWGRGRPGWHLECSAMIRAHLGSEIDIHGGGRDLIFPHHENERAQSCCADGGDFVRYWVHNAYVDLDGEKMSKSLGNVRTVRELLTLHSGEALRLALLSAHYRSPLNFSGELLESARSTLNTLYTALRPHASVVADEIEISDTAVFAALVDDLNTPEALAILHAQAKALNKASTAAEVARAKAELLVGGALLGILQQAPEAWFTDGADGDADTPEIEALIEARLRARENRDFQRADAIRDELLAAGIVLEDGAAGTSWRRK